MAKTRESKKLITQAISMQDAEDIFAEYATADAERQKLTAQMDVKLTEIREKYSDKLTELEEKKAEAFEKLQYFATTQPELFAKKKSISLTHGVLGFRTATPSLKTAKGYTWPSIVNLLKEFAPGYVRTKEEADKEKLLADRDDADTQTLFIKCGIKVEQAETFFVEPKKEE